MLDSDPTHTCNSQTYSHIQPHIQPHIKSCTHIQSHTAAHTATHTAMRTAARTATRTAVHTATQTVTYSHTYTHAYSRTCSHTYTHILVDVIFHMSVIFFNRSYCFCGHIFNSRGHGVLGVFQYWLRGISAFTQIRPLKIIMRLTESNISACSCM